MVYGHKGKTFFENASYKNKENCTKRCDYVCFMHNYANLRPLSCV